MKTFFNYISIFFIFLVSILPILFFNLGHILDVSEKPHKVDIIVSLGGGEKRILKSVELFEKGYSLKNFLIITGDTRTKKMKADNYEDKRVTYLKKIGIKNNNFFHNREVKNTKEEIIFVKKFLLEKNYRNAIIVSDPPHTRRIKSLISLTNVVGDEKLNFNIVSSNILWWDKRNYYKTKKAQVYALSEFLSILYSYIAYGFFEKIGLLETFEKTTKPIIKKLQQKLNEQSYFYMNSL